MTTRAAQYRLGAEANGPAIEASTQRYRDYHDAQHGSAVLFSALHREFRRFALKYGVTMHSAQLHCMNSEAKPR
jgi:hypothetical protein